MASTELETTAVIETLNRILEAELAGMIRYTHYSFMVYGYSRIPIVGWLRSQANESLLHAQEALPRSADTRPSASASYWKRRSTISAISCANRWSTNKRPSDGTSSCCT